MAEPGKVAWFHRCPAWAAAPSVLSVQPPTTQVFDRQGTAAFLVERYLPAAAVAGLADSVARRSRDCDEAGVGAARVRYLQSTYVPAEDTCFCLFGATSADAVRAVNVAAAFALDRVTDALVLFDCAPTPVAIETDTSAHTSSQGEHQ